MSTEDCMKYMHSVADPGIEKGVWGMPPRTYHALRQLLVQSDWGWVNLLNSNRIYRKYYYFCIAAWSWFGIQKHVPFNLPLPGSANGIHELHAWAFVSGCIKLYVPEMTILCSCCIVLRKQPPNPQLLEHWKCIIISFKSNPSLIIQILPLAEKLNITVVGPNGKLALKQ